MFLPRLKPVASALAYGARILATTITLASCLVIQAKAEPTPTLRFASRPQAEKLLSRQDDFSQRLSPFDRAARLKQVQDPGRVEFLRFVKTNAQEWSAAETERLHKAFDSIRSHLGGIARLLPAEVWCVKTSGNEEGHAAYTRGNMIVLPPSRTSATVTGLERLLAHELFHVLSRARPRLRDELYAVIGFERTQELQWPASLKDRRITNPDCPVITHAIRVSHGGKTYWGFPVLYSRTSAYDASKGGEFFDYLEFRLLLEPSEKHARRGRLSGGKESAPLLKKTTEVEGFRDQVGWNTDYILHPEEILADNFALLMDAKAAPKSPQILESMRRILREHAGISSR